MSQGLTVTAKDAYGNVATGYTGTAKFSSSDAAASLPANYTFPASADGSHTFAITFATAGSQSVTVTDTTSKFSATQSGINVAPAAPLNLSATAVSTSQINLAWTASAGATGYTAQISLNGGSTWTQLATVAGGTTSYQDTGLSAGTTYEYRVFATGGNLTSAASNVATATTTGAAATVNTIWSNSYTPPENAYSWGSYELGMKFTSTTAGEVTGVRFYKQTWMGGYTHVGHLWSSTGTLLATATFSNETSSGWQQVNFASPVSIQANTIYIVSFSTGGGYFGISTGFFTNGGVTSGPLQALSNHTSGGDGVYQAAGDFPNVNGSGMNFWVDVAFAPSASPGVQTSSASPGVAPARQWGVSPAATAAATPAGTSSSPEGRGPQPSRPLSRRRSQWLRGPSAVPSPRRGRPSGGV